jgi:pimeloyl-ACP methyl ester carboxylesterase
MAKPIELKIDVSGSVPLPGPLYLAFSVFLPDPRKLAVAPVVIFALPGGGYGRRYFDLQIPGHPGYSEADHHVERGIIFVAGDHLGVGDSTIPDLNAITLEVMAAANHGAVGEIVRRFARGTIDPDFPLLARPVVIGIGQSMGGCATIAMQGRHRTYDAIATLGYSAVHTVLPQPTEDARRAVAGSFRFTRGSDPRQVSIDQSAIDYVYPFHWEDVPRDILDADMAGGYPVRTSAPPWGSVTMPGCATSMMSPGFIAEEASQVDVPVLIGAGERDTLPDPHAEPGAFKKSRDVSVYVVPAMAHMHNFASTRRLLWDRIVDWSKMVAREVVNRRG